MSISPPDNLSQTGLVPQTEYPCFGYLTGANDGGYIYNFTPNSGLTLLIYNN